MTNPAMVFEDRDGQWRVEWFDDDGRSELEIFNGPDAHRQALRYAVQKYGHFKEVQSLGEIA
jgi:putative heme iron utilization protein